MLERQLLENYTLKSQTSFRNVLREYIQHLFLSSFYKKAGSENFLFKGGTALKLVFGSPRFSEDIDFSGVKNSSAYEKVLEKVLLDFSFENLKIEFLESKSTFGGHLAVLGVALFGENLEIRNEVSLRTKKFLPKKVIIVTSQIIPTYKVYTLDPKEMVKEKIKALVARQKPRDFFDLYFILRKEELRQALKLNPQERKKITSLLKKQNKREISRELRGLLPKSFWPVIKDLPTELLSKLS